MIHQDNEKKRPDTDFYPGDLKYLVKGNVCRLLDGRRTPGYIGQVFKDEGMFRFCITDYEDKGRYWDLNLEKASHFQFDKSASTCEDAEFKKIIKKFDQDLLIKDQTLKEDKSYFEDAKAYIKTKDMPHGPLDYKDEAQMNQIHQIFKSYMSSYDLWALEKQSQELMVLNPNSGEWFKGLYIVMAEMGLCNYIGKVPRTKTIFKGQASKEKRKIYIQRRLGFVRALFKHYKMEEVALFRGMSSEEDIKKVNRSLLNMTFSYDVASAFADMSIDKFRTSYIIKQTLHVDKLFMTCFETNEMNQRYKEKEAIVFYKDSFEI